MHPPVGQYKHPDLPGAKRLRSGNPEASFDRWSSGGPADGLRIHLSISRGRSSHLGEPFFLAGCSRSAGISFDAVESNSPTACWSYRAIMWFFRLHLAQRRVTANPIIRLIGREFKVKNESLGGLAWLVIESRCHE